MNYKLAWVPFLVLILIAVLGLFFPSLPNVEPDAATLEKLSAISGSDSAWMLTAAAFVLLMTPGLAFFYGGMVSSKNIISTMLQSFISMAVISVLWVVVGFSLAFGDSIGGLVGNPLTFFMFKDVVGGAPWELAPTIPLVLFAFFQLKFAIITPALITGAFAERIRFTSYVLFICLFSIFIYAPLAHWTWHPSGFLFNRGVLDFAGGTVVHMSAGWAALASVIYLKGRLKNGGHNEPVNIPFVILGTGMLWFGWFGFNAGSAFGSGSLAATALANTNTAPAAAALAWIFFDTVKGKKPSAIGACIGAIVGLVAITPAAGFVTVPHSIVIGIVASLISNTLVDWRSRTNLDDTLDVFPSHGVGGIVGMILTGVFAHSSVNEAVTDNGLFWGETRLFYEHILAFVIVSVFAFVGSLILLKITDMITPLRVSPEDEHAGLDRSQHGETYINR